MPKQTYSPISCVFYDIILDRCTRKIKIKVRYYNPDNIAEEVIDQIKDVYTKNNMEFMLLASGLKIRLDNIIAIDNELLESYEKECGI